jgi:hypothetical protein
VVAYGQLYNHCDATKAERELGYARRPLEDALRDTVLDLLGRGIVEPTTGELRALAGRKPALEPVLV